VGCHKGTLVEPTDDFFEGDQSLRNRKNNYYFVRFDEKGPYGNGRGIYLFSTWAIRPLFEPKKVVSSNGSTGEEEGTSEVTGSSIKEPSNPEEV
jgi:hypothetical protein